MRWFLQRLLCLLTWQLFLSIDSGEAPWREPSKGKSWKPVQGSHGTNLLGNSQWAYCDRGCILIQFEDRNFMHPGTLIGKQFILLVTLRLHLANLGLAETSEAFKRYAKGLWRQDSVESCAGAETCLFCFVLYLVFCFCFCFLEHGL